MQVGAEHNPRENAQGDCSPCRVRRFAAVHIGTSGWQYRHWKGPFYAERLPSSQMLNEYCRRFDTVEINNSFYRLPSAANFASWRRNTPPQFLFSIKASRFITHMKKLKDPEQGLAKLMERAELLEEKLGAILFQLPPGWGLNEARLESFLEALPRGRRFAFEFRHPGWHTERVYRLLRRYNAAFCIFHLAGFEAPRRITADFTYVRLHGPGGHYQGSYSHQSLSAWAEQIRHWQRHLAAIFVYFDNDQAGYAAANALELRRRLGGSEVPAAA